VEPSLFDFEITSKYNVGYPEKFPLRKWVPDNGRVSQVAILLHGFLEGIEPDEGRRNRWLSRYQSIAEELAAKNIASVFLPMPLHFERGLIPRTNLDEPMVVTQLKTNGTFLYYGGYDQLIDDIWKLVDYIKANPTDFGVNRIPRVHLIGYSLGGAAAMGAASKHPDHIESLSVLCSTWGLSSVSDEAVGRAFQGFGFGSSDWRRMLEELGSQRQNFDKAFRGLVWAEELTDFLASFPKRVLFVHGLLDHLFDPKMTHKASLDFWRIFQENSRSNSTANQECVFINFSSDHFYFGRRNLVADFVAAFVGTRR
jgi:pimeloyl-ACP methyl ester carboxylesterase